MVHNNVMRYKVRDVFDDVTKYGTKIKTSQYLEHGKYPIFDQGKDYIAGYTNEDEGIFQKVPVILFGDHTGILKYITRPCFLGADGVKLLKPKDSNIVVKYLFYALNNVNIPDAGYSRHFKWLKEGEIPIPPKEQQSMIVEILDELSYIVQKEKEMLIKFDELVKSRFIEMFGNPNEIDNFANAQIKDIALVKVGIVIKPTRFYSNDKKGKCAFRSLNIVPFGVNPNSEWVYFTNDAMAENKRTIVHEGDVLVVRSGNPGTCCVVPKEYDGCNVIDLIIAHPDKNRILPEYLCAFTNMPHGMNQINNQKHGVAQRHFNVSMYERMKIYIPSLSQQHQFVDFMIQVDKSKY